jgi:hypothetical protein
VWQLHRGNGGALAAVALIFVLIQAVVGLTSQSATVYLAQPVVLSACWGGRRVLRLGRRPASADRRLRERLVPVPAGVPRERADDRSGERRRRDNRGHEAGDVPDAVEQEMGANASTGVTARSR